MGLSPLCVDRGCRRSPGEIRQSLGDGRAVGIGVRVGSQRGFVEAAKHPVAELEKPSLEVSGLTMKISMPVIRPEVRTGTRAWRAACRGRGAPKGFVEQRNARPRRQGLPDGEAASACRRRAWPDTGPPLVRARSGRGFASGRGQRPPVRGRRRRTGPTVCGNSPTGRCFSCVICAENTGITLEHHAPVGGRARSRFRSRERRILAPRRPLPAATRSRRKVDFPQQRPRRWEMNSPSSTVDIDPFEDRVGCLGLEDCPARLTKLHGRSCPGHHRPGIIPVGAPQGLGAAPPSSPGRLSQPRPPSRVKRSRGESRRSGRVHQEARSRDPEHVGE